MTDQELNYELSGMAQHIDLMDYPVYLDDSEVDELYMEELNNESN